ncbi:MAG: xylose isomerase, partial [Pirellulaceae bacterium]
VVCLEPEPGCAIGATAQLRDFFESYLFAGDDQQVVRRHIGWCHDICHAAVMREDQEAEIQACFDMGIRLGKVQVSSALAIHWSRYQADQKEEVLQQLSSFAEDRYLHQTVAETASGARKWYEDLPAALASIDDVEQMEGTWSVHFHLPIHLAGMGILDTTRDQIGRCVEIVRRLQNQQAAAAWDWFTGIWEVETYAWGVLPPRLRPADLSEGIAAELQWFRSVALDNSDFCR